MKTKKFKQDFLQYNMKFKRYSIEKLTQVIF